ncbi:TPA: hypothetical protein EYO57_22195 [Candidatus Poribacteria bacterium]|nr:hypothetical protein [Candidatus Poribacteria bacterium]HIN75257.1 hypothetical protein [Rhodospirillales bacterium]
MSSVLKHEPGLETAQGVRLLPFTEGATMNRNRIPIALAITLTLPALVNSISFAQRGDERHPNQNRNSPPTMQVSASSAR